MFTILQGGLHHVLIKCVRLKLYYTVFKTRSICDNHSNNVTANTNWAKQVANVEYVKSRDLPSLRHCSDS